MSPVEKYLRLYTIGEISQEAAIQSLRSYIMSLTLQRDFGVTFESWLESRPDIKEKLHDAKLAIDFLSKEES